ncbi:hypothetical protein TNCV_3736341 [Trichonephila clavipes]|nr:hypothetical protein TNCV_3736341 [Trichonephila clavipes]
MRIGDGSRNLEPLSSNEDEAGIPLSKIPHHSKKNIVLLKTRRSCRGPMHVKYVEAPTSFRWCGVEVRRRRAGSGVVLVIWQWFKIMKSVSKSLRVAKYSVTLIFTHSIEK